MPGFPAASNMLDEQRVVSMKLRGQLLLLLLQSTIDYNKKEIEIHNHISKGKIISMQTHLHFYHAAS